MSSKQIEKAYTNLHANELIQSFVTCHSEELENFCSIGASGVPHDSNAQAYFCNPESHSPQYRLDQDYQVETSDRNHVI